jgi:SIR2-like domain
VSDEEVPEPKIIKVEDSGALDLVSDAVRSQRCILFLGTGVHAESPTGSPFEYPPERRPLVSSALSRELAVVTDFTEHFPGQDPGNLQRVALAYEMAFSRARLVDAVAYAVDAGKEPSPMLRALARLDFPLVITTNYDQLFERALRDTGKQPRVAVYKPQREATVDFLNPTAQSPVIYKLHGDISHPESLVVTDADHIQFVLRMSDKKPYDLIPLSLKSFLANLTTVFVGYNLLDYNLRLLFMMLHRKIDNANLPDMYSIDPAPDPLIMHLWQSQRRYVNFIAQDIWTFVPRLYELVVGQELLS